MTASSAACGLVAVGPAALGHVGPAAAALPAERRDRLDQVDRVDLRARGRRYPDGDAGAALVDRDERRDARADALLGLVDQAAQLLGIDALRAPGRELVAADLFGSGGVGLAAAAHRQRLLRVGELALEPAALVDQRGDPRRHLLGRRS